MTDTDQISKRLERLEQTMIEVQMVQTETRGALTSLKWAGGIAAALVVAVVGVNLQQGLSLTGQIAKNATTLGFVREDLAEIKSELTGLRADVQSIAGTVGAPLQGEEKKAELAR